MIQLQVNLDPRTITQLWFLASMFTCAIVAIGTILRIYLKQKNIKGDQGYVTGTFDDYYPMPRRIRIDKIEEPESGFHIKLNYQILIERMTRKLYHLFILIIFFATGFIYVLYSSSLSEAIAPSNLVLSEYTTMMDSIIYVEDKLNVLQKNQIDQYFDVKQLIKDQQNSSSKPSEENLIGPVEKTRTLDAITNMLTQHINEEDKLFVDVSEKFYNIYYARYIIVRLFIATIMFTLLTYFIRLYFNIRSDRTDYMRKEEALSTYLSIASIAGNTSIKEYDLLKDKIPEFPLNQLFYPTTIKGKSQWNGSQNFMVANYEMMTKLMGSQKELIDSVITDLKNKTNIIT